MKKIITIGVTAILFAACEGDKFSNAAIANKVTPAAITEKTNTDKDARIFGVESGIVEVIHGEDKTKEILYFDHWGVRRAMYTYRTFGTEKFTPYKLLINDGAIEYDISLASNIGSKLNRPIQKIDDSLFLEERKLQMMGCSKMREGKVGDYTCAVWGREGSRMESRTFFYKGITLQVQIKFDNDVTTSKLVRFEENAKIDTTVFNVPKEIKF
ncbi:MAG: hypothetical protein ACRCYO_18560 [Bacteroidia bacterium]